MKIYAKKSKIIGEISIPGSKSHTIRALFLALMTKKESSIHHMLISKDTMSALDAIKKLGAKVKIEKDTVFVKGVDGNIKVPRNVIDVGNSGTTLRLLLTLCALIDGYTIITGDEQIIKRPLKELIISLEKLGGRIISTKGDGCAPVVVKGPLSGNETTIKAVTSQFLSSLLIGLPFGKKDVDIDITLLNEKPYVDITLWWLDMLNIKYENYNYKRMKVFGNQRIKSFNVKIPGDFSSASFFIVAACITKGEVTLKNLDIKDSQGDKRILQIIEDMGAEVKYTKDSIIVKSSKLKGLEIDMNDIPDALPIMAVCACFAKGTTKLLNVPQARLKETDRISVMYKELKKMGADIKELEDGLIIKYSKLKASRVNGWGDHRIIMSLVVAAMGIEGESIIDEAEAMDVTFPDFIKLMKSLGADLDNE